MSLRCSTLHPSDLHTAPGQAPASALLAAAALEDARAVLAVLATSDVHERRAEGAERQRAVPVLAVPADLEVCQVLASVLKNVLS